MRWRCRVSWPFVGRVPEPHNIALEDRLLAALRESDGGLTSLQAAQAVGTIPCQCRNPALLVALRARHDNPRRYPGSCGGTGWRQATDVDVRGRLGRLERCGLVGRSNVAGNIVFWLRVQSADPFTTDPFTTEPFWQELAADIERLERRNHEPWEERFYTLWEGETWPGGVPYTEPNALRLLGLERWP